MSLMRKFKEHPATVGETYWQHFMTAMSFSLALLRAAFCCGVHAVFPFLFEKTGSQCIVSLHEKMVTNRARMAEQAGVKPGTVAAKPVRAEAKAISG